MAIIDKQLNLILIRSPRVIQKHKLLNVDYSIFLSNLNWYGVIQCDLFHRYARQARNIVNQVRVNEDANAKMIKGETFFGLNFHILS